ncbi:MAG: MFS transporter [Desulfotomaculaceae bacterium]|nr:MFS transporter [Desulfotomaculaceae bacterium]
MDQNASLRKATLISASTAAFLTPFMGSAVNLAIPNIGLEFNASATLLSWTVSSYLLITAALLLPFGRLADMVGRKKVFVTGLAIFTLGSLLCAVAWSIQSLIMFRLLQGVGGAMIFGTSMAILTSVFPPQERGKVLGYNVAAVYTGLSLGPVLGGVLNHQLGWRSIYYVIVLLGAAAFVITSTKLKGEWLGAEGERFDTTGTALYIVGLVAVLYGISTIATSTWAKYILVLGLIVMVLFVRHEIREQHPILNMKLFKNVGFAFSNLAALINYSATFAVGFLLSLHLQVVMGVNSQSAGLILLSQPIIMAVLSPFSGRLSDRVEPRVIASWGMSLTTLGLFILVFISRNTPIWLIILNLALLGTGFALFSSPNSNAIMGSVEKRFYGVASSTLGTMRLIGQAVSMAVATLFIDLYVGTAVLSPAYANQIVTSVKVSFVVFAVTCLFGIYASMARGKIITEAERG